MVTSHKAEFWNLKSFLSTDTKAEFQSPLGQSENGVDTKGGALYLIFLSQS
jgi:hypothetical protein